MSPHIPANSAPIKLTRNRFGSDSEGRITFNGQTYLHTSLGTTTLGLARAEQFAAWLNQCAQIIEDGAPLPASIQEALNSGDGSYRP